MDFGREEWNWKRHGTVRLAIRQWNGSNMPYRTTRYLGIVTNALASGHVRSGGRKGCAARWIRCPVEEGEMLYKGEMRKMRRTR